jgi:integrase/recombinase XerC
MQMRKFNAENERVKRDYIDYLRHADGKSEATVDKIAAALIRFEESTGFKSFKNFHIEQAKTFKRNLERSRNPNSGEPLSVATRSATLRLVKAFFKWLAFRPGYRSKINPADAEYFNLTAKDEAVAHASWEKPFPSMQQALHAFRNMPDVAITDRRNKALFALLLMTGMRGAALGSLKMRNVDIIEGQIYQDARDMKTKASKSFLTVLCPVADDVRHCFDDWITHLREVALLSPTDAAFPQTAVSAIKGYGFQVTGLARAPWATTEPVRRIVGDAFENVGLPRFGPHTLRKTLEQWGARRYKSPEAFKAFSQNLGHEHVLTTFTSYGAVSPKRQAEIIRGDD